MKQETMQSKIKSGINSANTLASFTNDLQNWNNGKTGGQRLQAAASAVAKIIGATS